MKKSTNLIAKTKKTKPSGYEDALEQAWELTGRGLDGFGKSFFALLLGAGRDGGL